MLALSLPLLARSTRSGGALVLNRRVLTLDFLRGRSRLHPDHVYSVPLRGGLRVFTTCYNFRCRQTSSFESRISALLISATLYTNSAGSLLDELNCYEFSYVYPGDAASLMRKAKVYTVATLLLPLGVGRPRLLFALRLAPLGIGYLARLNAHGYLL
jgi:hypothetical protein